MRLSAVLAGVVVMAAVCGCSASGTVSATGRVPGDSGKLLPVPCWVEVSQAGGEEGSILEVTRIDGTTPQCKPVVQWLSEVMPVGGDYSVKQIAAPNPGDLNGGACSGDIDGAYQAALMDAWAGLSAGDDVVNALGLSCS